jgi:hypothetical protein
MGGMETGENGKKRWKTVRKTAVKRWKTVTGKWGAEWGMGSEEWEAAVRVCCFVWDFCFRAKIGLNGQGCSDAPSAI